MIAGDRVRSYDGKTGTVFGRRGWNAFVRFDDGSSRLIYVGQLERVR